VACFAGPFLIWPFTINALVVLRERWASFKGGLAMIFSDIEDYAGEPDAD
jgi:hypothetical protein